MTEQQYHEALAAIREDFSTGLHLNPLHCGKDPQDINWVHWKHITRLLQQVCRYEKENKGYTHEN